jgi:D-3-phosphoglycerate dehydrogenase
VLVTIRERTPIQAALVERLPRLKFVSQSGEFPHIDVAALTRNGVLLSALKMPPQPSYATAELALGLMIAVMRKIPQQMAALKAGNWQLGLGTGLRGRTLGIFSYGRLGSALAGYCKALGMNVLAWGSQATRAQAEADGFTAASSKDEFFSTCDVVSLHLRLVNATRGIVTAQDLACMKHTSIIINTSRAGLIQPGALVEALRAGRPGAAGIDVYEQEPVTTHPLFEFPNVVCTPHIGYLEKDAFESQFSRLFDQVNAYFAGHPINMVNPEVLRS